jgi:hypothetical protein
VPIVSGQDAGQAVDVGGLETPGDDPVHGASTRRSKTVRPRLPVMRTRGSGGEVLEGMHRLLGWVMELVNDIRNVEPIQLSGIVKPRIEHFISWTRNGDG